MYHFRNKNPQGRFSKLQLLCIIGPTAVGKTDLSIQLAKIINGEIVSVDSRQIYKYMDIGTAKPTPEQMQEVPHHMVDCVLPDQDFSVADYQEGADEAIEEIARKGKTPILVGGSGMYFRAVIDGLFDGPSADRKFREKLKKEADKTGIYNLYHRMKSVDPEAAERIHPNDLLRIIRALEVYEKTGKPISQLQKQWENSKDRYESVIIGLNRPRDELYQRIEKRVDQMMENGLLEEVKSLSRYSRNLRAMNCFGYKELFEYIDGKCPLDESIRLLKQNTRRYAKRQLTWFRKDKRIQWINISNISRHDIIQKILQKWNES
ncbi:tRNA (adenosine(37)-N6)-dimethylallyltransferase MiaA [Candidatus Poribacteria bacterium]|nr:tRNA (adenosine(37)-N6)-dimethylallyltransferase MiaA [Candidatus Poribacteria bacterium]